MRTLLGETPPRDPKQIAAALLGFMRREIRYTGSEFHQAAMVLHSPSETIARKYGDLKVYALLLTALLRAAGLTAQIALLRAQPVPEADESLPGFGLFDHLLVRVAGPTPFWIDPIAPLTRPGELPAADQGKLALLIDPRDPRAGCARPPSPRLPTAASIFARSRWPRPATRTWWRAWNARRVRSLLARRYRGARPSRRGKSGARSRDLPSDVVDHFEFTDIHNLDEPFKLSAEVTSQSAVTATTRPPACRSRARRFSPTCRRAAPGCQ